MDSPAIIATNIVSCAQPHGIAGPDKPRMLHEVEDRAVIDLLATAIIAAIDIEDLYNALFHRVRWLFDRIWSVKRKGR